VIDSGKTVQSINAAVSNIRTSQMAGRAKRKAGGLPNVSHEDEREAEINEESALEEDASSDESGDGLVASSSEDEGALASDEEESNDEFEGESEEEDGEGNEEGTEELAQAVQDYYQEKDKHEAEDDQGPVRGQEEVGVSGRGEEEERLGKDDNHLVPQVEESDSSEDEVCLELETGTSVAELARVFLSSCCCLEREAAC
jgi:hypothetical protein